MKKNVVGKMSAPKVSAGTRFRRFHLFSKLFCLLLALVIWLMVVNLTETDGKQEENDPSVTVTDPI